MAGENEADLTGHGVCYLRGEIDHVNEMRSFHGSCADWVITPSYSIAEDADAYALGILGMSPEHYQKLFDNIVRSTVREMVLVPAEYDTLLKMVRDGYTGRKERVAARLSQIREKMCQTSRNRYQYGRIALWIPVIWHICRLMTNRVTAYKEKRNELFKLRKGNIGCVRKMS